MKPFILFVLVLLGILLQAGGQSLSNLTSAIETLTLEVRFPVVSIFIEILLDN